MAQKKKFEITEELIKGAATYIPLEDKMAFAEAVAESVLEPVEISAQKIQSDEVITLPQLWEENPQKKQLFLMQLFLRHYLRVEVPDNFSTRDYDEYAKVHPINQLERFKGNTEVKHIIFDLLADYKELKKLLDIKIFNLKATRNDALERFLAGVNLLSTPDNLKALTSSLKQATEQLQQRGADIAKLQVAAGKLETQASNAETKKFVSEKKS